MQWVWYSSLIGTVISASIALVWLAAGLRQAIDRIGGGESPLGARELTVDAAAKAAEPA